MIRPTETWQPRLEAVDTHTTLPTRRDVVAAELRRSWEENPPFQLPLPSRARDLQYLRQNLQTSLPLWMADLVAVLTATFLAWLLAGNGFPFQATVVSLGLAFSVVNRLLGLYPGIGLSAEVELKQTTCATTLIGIVYGLTNVSVAGELNSIPWPMGIVYIGCVVLMPLTRRTARRFVCGCRWWSQPILIFGSGEVAAAAFGNLMKHPQLGLRPVGLVESNRWDSANSEFAPSWYLVPAHDSPDALDTTPVFWGVLAMPDHDSGYVAHVLDHLALSLPHLLVIPPLAGSGRDWHGAQRWGDLLASRIDVRLLLPAPKLIKRLSDLLLTAIAAAVLLPLIVLITLLVKLGSAGPSLYSHERIGRYGRRFRAWKFRTMSVDAEKLLHEYLARNPDLESEWNDTHKLRCDPRVTGIGWLLRKTSLDELPQLWNVLVGDMSLVGPRPIVQAEIEKYESTFGLYCRVRPGITGLWQINGRNDTTYAQRVAYDQLYTRNWSPWMDICILVRTIRVVLLCEGAY